jgi:hypothetical protein
LFVVSPAKTCVYSSKFLASCIHKLEFKFSWVETWMQNLCLVKKKSLLSHEWMPSLMEDSWGCRHIYDSDHPCWFWFKFVQSFLFTIHVKNLLNINCVFTF